MSARPNPIFSVHEHDAELREAIDRFVVHLGEQVDHLQDAETAGDLERLRSLADRLAERSERMGYGPLSLVAQNVSKACLDDKPEVAQEALVELTDVSRRIRLGHRGAA